MVLVSSVFILAPFGWVWRRERDSNPRHGFPYSGFQDHRHRPLGHPSVFAKPSDFQLGVGETSPASAKRTSLGLATARQANSQHDVPKASVSECPGNHEWELFTPESTAV